jgi:riboflavin biosynthesis pyrimidine reductase
MGNLPKTRLFRRSQGKNGQADAENPLLVIVSGSGQLELERAVFRTAAMRTVVVTTSAGRDELRRRGAATLGSVEIHALDSSSGSIAPQAILQLLRSQFGVSTLLHEGGLTLLGNFWRQMPQIAGRKGDVIRPSVV